MPQVLNFIGKRGVASDFYFSVEVPSATNDNRFLSAAVPWIAGDVKVSLDGATAANVASLPTRIDSTTQYKLSLTAAEMAAAFVHVFLVDADGPAWRDVVINIQNEPVTPVLRMGVAQAGGAATVTLDASASATNDYYNGAVVSLVGGTGIGQARVIVDYDGGTKVATVNRSWSTNPASGTTFIVAPGEDVWNVAPSVELASQPTATSAFGLLLQFLFERFYHKRDQTATTFQLYKADSSTVLSSATVSDDNTTFTTGKLS